MTAFQLGGFAGDELTPQVPPSAAALPPTHPVVVLETAASTLRDAVADPDAIDAAGVAAVLAEREVAIRSLGRALGPRPPRLLVERLERVLVEDRAIVSTLQAHLDEVRAEIATLSRGRSAAAAYAAAGRHGRGARP